MILVIVYTQPAGVPTVTQFRCLRAFGNANVCQHVF
jgi:hypothetical protein